MTNNPSTPTPVSAWKQGVEAEVLQVPSGNVCRARKEGLKAFVKAGMIPNSLLPIIMQALKKGTTDTAGMQRQIEKDPQKIGDILRLMDNVVVNVVVEPRVLPLPPEEDVNSDHYDPEFERDEEDLYVDQVDPNDKVFIFSWACGGTSDLEQFRVESLELLDTVDSSPPVARPAKRAPRPRKRQS